MTAQPEPPITPRITHTACTCYVRLHGWSEHEREDMEQAARELRDLFQRAHFVKRDRLGREMWRSPRAEGWLRWVIDPRKVHARDLPRVIWIGQSRPPARLWAHEESSAHEERSAGAEDLGCSEGPEGPGGAAA